MPNLIVPDHPPLSGQLQRRIAPKLGVVTPARAEVAACIAEVEQSYPDEQALQ